MAERPSGLYDPNYRPKKQIEVRGTSDPKEFAWKCPICGTVNIEMKRSFTSNHQFQCVGHVCGYKFAVVGLPDDMRHWMQNEEATPSIDVRPRITNN